MKVGENWKNMSNKQKNNIVSIFLVLKAAFYIFITSHLNIHPY